MGSYEREPLVDTATAYDDWRDQLIQDGYVVLKGIITEERSQYYLNSLFEWLESFPYGFKKDDKSTWGPTHLPAHIKLVYISQASCRAKVDTNTDPILEAACTMDTPYPMRNSSGRRERESRSHS